jgi:transcriptional regulator of acetoin/glycerol metabolism
MATINQSAALLVRMRDRVVDSGDWSGTDRLRPEIAASWRRCIAGGLVPSLAASVDPAEVNPSGLLSRVARGVLEKRSEQLADTSTGLIVADKNGVVLDRWTANDRLAKLLDASGSDRGWWLDESVAGTNGIGTVLEELKPVRIVGAEHFTDAFHEFACAGVPIRHPITRRLQGVLNLTCRVEDVNNLLLPFALETAHEIERLLYLGSSRKERLLLEQFLHVQKRSDHPVLVLNDQLVITNAAAARLLDDVEQAMLWEHASTAIRTRGQIEVDVSLQSGEILTVRCSPVEDAGVVIGAIVDIPRKANPVRPGVSARSRQLEQPALQGLVGTSAAWRETYAEAMRVRRSDVPIVVSGAPGSGKLSLVQALFAEEDVAGRLAVFDAALQSLDGTVGWLTPVRQSLLDPTQTVVIRHLAALDPQAAQALCGLLDAAGSTGARVVATLNSIEELVDGPHRELADRLSVASITVPSLRDRLDDLPLLLAELTRRHSRQDNPPRWLADAVQTLSRLDYPANIRELENIVRRTLVGRNAGDIRAADLPKEVRGSAPRRRLTRLEQIECDAILTALQRVNGNKSEAAEQLGISRATLYRKTRTYGLELGSAAY